MNRLAAIILVILVALALLIYIASTRQGKPDTPVRATTLGSKDLGVTSEPRGDSGAPEPPGLPQQSGRARAPALKMWEDVSDLYALKLFTFGGAHLRPGIIPRSYADVLAELGWQVEYGLGAQAYDNELRDIALIQYWDWKILKHAGVDFKDWGGGDPESYFPGVFHDAVTVPGDAVIVRGKLADLLKSGVDTLRSRFRGEFDPPGAEQGLRVRTLLLLSGLGRDPETMTLLREGLYGDGDPRLKSAAATGLLVQGEDEDVRAWLLQQSDPDLIRAFVSGLASHDGMGVYPSRDPAAWYAAYRTAQSTLGRDLDPELLAITRGTDDRQTHLAGLVGLTARLDNPDIADYVSSYLATSNDEAAIISILRLRPALTGREEYHSALSRFIDSPRKPLALLALGRIGFIPEERVVDRIIPFLAHPDLQFARVAADALGSCGGLKPRESLRALEEALLERSGDTRFAKRARDAIKNITHTLEDSETLEAYLHQQEERNPHLFGR